MAKKNLRINNPKRLSLRNLRKITISLMWQNLPIKALEVVLKHRPWSRRRSMCFLLSLPKMPVKNGAGNAGTYGDNAGTYGDNAGTYGDNAGTYGDAYKRDPRDS